MIFWIGVVLRYIAVQVVLVLSCFKNVEKNKHYFQEDEVSYSKWCDWARRCCSDVFSRSDHHVDSGNDGDIDRGNIGDVDSGNDGDVDSGNDGHVASDKDIDCGTNGNFDSGNYWSWYWQW